jgi:3-phenylpropionate/trans-cinnamate dioxygenase ferredoxin subunit
MGKLGARRTREVNMGKKRVRVGGVGEIEPGRVKVVSAGETRLAVCRVGDEYFAIEDVCTHDDGPLGAGSLDGAVIECPRHGARFDVRTGAVLRMPAVAPVPTFPVQIEEGELFVEVETD